MSVSSTKAHSLNLPSLQVVTAIAVLLLFAGRNFSAETFRVCGVSTDVFNV